MKHSFIFFWPPLLIALALSSCTKKNIPSKDTLVVAWENLPKSLDTRFALGANSQYLSDLTDCTLFNYAPNGSLIPELVQKHEWTSPTQLKIKIKPHIKFADGSFVTPEDVIATYRYFITEDVPESSPRKGAFKLIKSISLSSEKEIIFDLHSSDATFLTNLIIGILPQKLASQGRLKEVTQLNGCGAFELKEATLTQLTLTPNPHYSLGDKPKLKKILIKIVSDESTRYAKLLKGEVDVVQNGVSLDKLKKISSNTDLKVLRSPALKTTYMGFNMRDKIIANPKVRQAISYAIDRKKIINIILKGYGTPAQGLLTPKDQYLRAYPVLAEYNPEKAKTLLDEAGYKDPEGDKKRLTLAYKTTNNQTRITIGHSLASQLAEVGIELKVEAREWGKFTEDIMAGRMQLWGLTWIGFKDPDILRYVYHSSMFPPNGGNRGWYKNPELDLVLEQAHSTLDTNKRKVLYEKAQSFIAKNPPYAFLWHQDNFAVVRKNVHDYELYADGRLSSLVKVYKD